MEKLARYRGSLIGLAAGDALGTTLEFQIPGNFTPITDMVGGGPFSLQPGQWTDDTSMALCLAESLIERKAFDPVDQLTRYCRWWREGHLSSANKCFDIGRTIQKALTRFLKTHEPYCGSIDPATAGNGSIMRLAPVPLFYARYPRLAIEKAAESSRTTHAAIEAVDGCRFLAAIIIGCLKGLSKEQILAEKFDPGFGSWQERPLAEKIATVAAGSYKHRNPPQIRGRSYVVDSLEAALWAFYHSKTFAEGALLAVNLGNDADTTGAVFGQIGGAFYGEEGIPANWRSKLVKQKLILEFADKLYALAEAG